MPVFQSALAPIRASDVLLLVLPAYCLGFNPRSLRSERATARRNGELLAIPVSIRARSDQSERLPVIVAGAKSSEFQSALAPIRASDRWNP